MDKNTELRQWFRGLGYRNEVTLTWDNEQPLCICTVLMSCTYMLSCSIINDPVMERSTFLNMSHEYNFFHFSFY